MVYANSDVQISNPRTFLKMLWRFHVRIRIEPDGKTVTPYDPHGRVSPLLVEETQKRSADLMPFVHLYMARQEAHCAAWEARGAVERPLTPAERRKRKGTESMRQGSLL